MDREALSIACAYFQSYSNILHMHPAQMEFWASLLIPYYEIFPVAVSSKLLPRGLKNGQIGPAAKTAQYVHTTVLQHSDREPVA